MNLLLFFRNANDWQTSAKITFIENQIKLCEAINSPDELKHWYTMLAFQLAISGDEKKVRLLLNTLLYSTPHTLLEEVNVLVRLIKILFKLYSKQFNFHRIYQSMIYWNWF